MGTRPLRLLVIAPYPLFPIHAGGKVRIVKLARHLAELGVDVTVAAPFGATRQPADTAREPFTLLSVKYPFVVPALLTDRPFPFGVLVSYHPGYGALLRRQLDEFDILQIEHPAFVDLADQLAGPGTPVVYGSQNVEFDYVRDECGADWVRRLAGRRMRALEQRLIDRAALVFACSEADGKRFGELYGAAPERVKVVPNGVDLQRMVPADSGRAGNGSAQADRDVTHESGSRRVPGFADPRPIVLFSGSDVAHNRECVDSILRDLAPAFPERAFVLHGRCARHAAGRHGPNVFLDADGSDLAPYVRAGTVGLNPVVRGSGTSMKSLYYLAHGLPVVTTAFGMRGLDDLADLVTVSNREGFADALQREHRLPESTRDRLQPYTWRRIASDALHAYTSIACTPA